MEKQCELKRELLREYMATLEKFKMAEREHKELLLARTTKRVEAIKKLCTTARMNYRDHRLAHHC
jgi:hypothetical protein